MGAVSTFDQVVAVLAVMYVAAALFEGAGLLVGWMALAATARGASNLADEAVDIQQRVVDQPLRQIGVGGALASSDWAVRQHPYVLRRLAGEIGGGVANGRRAALLIGGGMALGTAANLLSLAT